MNDRGCDTPDQTAGRRTLNLLCASVALLAALAFAPTVGYDFVNYDDHEYVLQNPQVNGGFSVDNVAWALTANYQANWHPLTWLSHMLDCQVYGLWSGGHHLTNVLLHTANAALLLVFLRSLTSQLCPSAIAAALFAIHPLRAGSVAWVAERKDLLSGLLFLLTLLAYLRFVRRSFALRRYLLVALLFVLGLMAKPMLVTLPLVLLLLDYWPLARLGRSTIVEKLPWMALAAASCGVTLWAQRSAMQSFDDIPFAWRIGNALVSYVVYAVQWFCPLGLSAYYPHDAAEFAGWQVGIAAITLVSISAAAWFGRTRSPYLLVGWLWFGTMLVPVIGLVQVGEQARADRYTYLPHVGLCLAVVWSVVNVCRTTRQRRGAAAMCALLVLPALLLCTWHTASQWRDSETLWNRSLSRTPRNFLAYYNLGVEFNRQQRYDEAFTAFQRAVALRPGHSEARLNLGNHYLRRGNAPEAEVQLQKAVELRPHSADARGNLGNVLRALGRLDAAQTCFEEALRLDPRHLTTYINYGALLAASGQWQAALVRYRQALEINPHSPEAHYNLALALPALGQLTMALEHARMAVELRPDWPETHNNLANLLGQQGRTEEALAAYQRTLALNPRHAEAHFNVGLLLQQQQKFAEAREHWQAALRWQPNHPLIITRMAWLLATTAQAEGRDVLTALQLSRDAVRLTGGRNPDAWDALAAACAQDGRFSEAVQAAQQALTAARAQNNATLANAIEKRLRLYQSGRPFSAAK